MGKLKTQNSKVKTTIKSLKLFKFLLLSCGFYFLLFSFTFSCYAGDIQFEATVDRNRVTLGEALQLNLSFHGTQDVPRPQLDKIEGFDARYVGPSTRVSIVNGVVTSSITYVYTLVPLKTGTFTIGPFSAEARGRTLTSKTITVEVVSSPSRGQQHPPNQPLQGQPPSQINAEELKDRLFLILSAGKRKAYLNEIMPLTVKLYVNRLGVRDIQFPVLETNGFSIGKFGQPRQYREEFGGVLYDVIEFTTDMFAVKPGEFTLGPARLKCNLVVRRQAQRRRSPFDDDFFEGIFGDDIFDRYEAYPLELKSTELPITVLPLPEEGRPESFDGALGDYQLEAEATPLQVKAGDPITLKMAIRGEGNFDTVNCPRLESKEGFKVYEPQIRQAEGAKEFEQVLIPESERISQIPGIRFSFFNTATGQYQVLTHGPIPINVIRSEEGQLKIVEAPQTAARYPLKEELGRDIIYIKNSLGKIRKKDSYLYQNLGFWVVQFAAFALFVGMFLFHRRKERLRTDLRYARRRRAPARARKGMQEAAGLLRAGKSQEFFDAVFKTIREYLADRFHLPAGGITAITIEALAKEKNLDAEILNRIKGLFADCDMARYAPLEFNKQKMDGVLEDLKQVIDYLEREKV